MNRFCGNVGYVITRQTTPGVWEENVVLERRYFGDILRNANRWSNSSYQNDDFGITNQFSIVADAYAYQNFNAIKYIVYSGIKWKVTSAELNDKRIILTLGGEYNGPEPEEDET